MKKIKSLLFVMAAMFIMPTITHAATNVYFTSYAVGDEIEVQIGESGKKANFHVIEVSDSSSETVLAMYDGTVGTSSWSDKSKSDFASSTARSALVYLTTNAGWDTYDTLTLVSNEQLEKLGFVSNKIDVSSADASWILASAPYWTTNSTVVDDKVYASSVNASGVIENIEVTTDSINLRPVVLIHKGWVTNGMICNCEDCGEEDRYCPNDKTINIQSCIDGGLSEAACIAKLCPSNVTKVCPNDKTINIQSCIDGGKDEKTCISELCPADEEKVENPTTGNNVPLIFGIFSVVLGSAYLVSRKQKPFNKVK